MSDGECHVMVLVGLRHMGNLCVTILGKKQGEKLPVLCLVLWKSRGQSCLHGAEVWLLSAGPINVLLFVLLQQD